MGKEFCAGIDVGGTKISAALFSPDGGMTCRKKVPLERAGGDDAARQLAETIGRLEAAAQAEGNFVRAVGVCVPGVVYQRTGLVWAPNIPGWDHFPLTQRISKHAGLPLVVDSDRAAYVLGEQWRGAARGVKDVVFLAVGTGIGAGIISGGRLCRGSEDIAGAVGWFGLNPGFKKEYAAIGCFEAEASGNSVGRKARERVPSAPDSVLLRRAGGRAEDITAETVVASAKDKDPLAVRIIEETVLYLAMGLANIVSLLNPDMVVLGGGLFQAGEFLLEPVKREFVRWAQPLAAQSVRVELSQLGEDAGLYGAGRLAWDSLKGGSSCPV